ncbi:hypothetical protein OG2516_15454 [Oceanicola granulosus HTCC2516]|uniref:NAD-dependent epimerase/dehydratase domain-containing protein n=1 Tax=Oceanicola granulosus (strain ATCC BAA-861 / DSM 15982 / KCTC 12143 / HTCC2516) TaxID=314256 RepID=Q2CFC2_OCEGH|nr:NAD-dependent epimerase/dehydratase family protein [Oceanicola granulosus]EAR51373.1 hypothetical protein OG2516_15454 [Oceanicola granulosus HTCC2516]
MERVLVTGATGFLGGALARTLRAEGRRVIATGRDPADLAAARTAEAVARLRRARETVLTLARWRPTISFARGLETVTWT